MRVSRGALTRASRQVGTGPAATMRAGAGTAVYGDALFVTTSGGMRVDSLTRKSQTGQGVNVRAPLVLSDDGLGISAVLERVLPAEALGRGYLVNAASAPVTQCTLPSALALARALGVRAAPAYIDVVIDNSAADADVVLEAADGDSSVVFAASFSSRAVGAHDVATLRFLLVAISESEASVVVAAWGAAAAGTSAGEGFDGILISESPTALAVGPGGPGGLVNPVFSVDASGGSEAGTAGIVMSRDNLLGAKIDTRGSEPLAIGCASATSVRIGAPLTIAVSSTGTIVADTVTDTVTDTGPKLAGYSREGDVTRQEFSIDGTALSVGPGADQLSADGSSLGRTTLLLRRQQNGDTEPSFSAQLDAETGLALQGTFPGGNGNVVRQAGLAPATGLTLGDASISQTRAGGPLRASHPCLRAYTSATLATDATSGTQPQLAVSPEDLMTGYITLPAPTSGPAYGSVAIPSASDFVATFSADSSSSPVQPMTFDFVVDVTALAAMAAPPPVLIQSGGGDVVAPEANMFLNARDGVGHFRLSFNPLRAGPGVLSRLDAPTPLSTVLTGNSSGAVFYLTAADSGATFLCDALAGSIEVFLPAPSPHWKFRFVSTDSIGPGLLTQANVITFKKGPGNWSVPKVHGRIVNTDGGALDTIGNPILGCTPFNNNAVETDAMLIMEGCGPGDYLDLEGFAAGGSYVHVSGVAKAGAIRIPPLP